jgi:hypothetical protein
VARGPSWTWLRAGITSGEVWHGRGNWHLCPEPDAQPFAPRLFAADVEVRLDAGLSRVWMEQTPMEPVRNSSAEHPGIARSSSRPARGRRGGLLLGVALTSCTLTQDDFEPAVADAAPLTEAAPLEPVVDAGSEPVPPAVSAPPATPACSAEVACPSGFACVDAVCAPSACAGSEDPSACVIAPCTDGSCAQPSCEDGVRNRDETGPDCGGTLCGACAAGITCRSSSDCEAGAFCSPATQACAAQSCDNGLRDGTESGVDCGGGCPGCEPGVACGSARDCGSGVCADGACAAPTCSDTTRNADEVDVDCGGNCEPCAPGNVCSVAADCASGVCGAAGCAPGGGLCCQAPSCQDTLQNGAETGVDCGAPGCSGCPLGTACGAGAQCATNVCAAGECATLCADGVRDGDEGGVDCGGSERGCGACPRCDEQNSVDLGTVGSQTSLPGNSCAIITTLPGYAPSLLNSVDDGPYPITIAWRQECSAAVGSAVFSAAFELLPIAGLSAACPVIFDLGGSAEPFALIWY